MRARQARILVADNDPGGRAALRRQLRGGDCDVHCVSSGSDVVWHCYAAPPDVLILDVNLPDMDGFEVCAYVRHCAGGWESTIIFVSAAVDEMTRVYLGQMVDYAGGDYFFTKPYDARLLARVVDEELRGKRDKRDGAYPARFVSPTRAVWPTSRCGVKGF